MDHAPLTDDEWETVLNAANILDLGVPVLSLLEPCGDAAPSVDTFSGSNHAPQRQGYAQSAHNGDLLPTDATNSASQALGFSIANNPELFDLSLLNDPIDLSLLSDTVEHGVNVTMPCELEPAAQPGSAVFSPWFPSVYRTLASDEIDNPWPASSAYSVGTQCQPNDLLKFSSAGHSLAAFTDVEPTAHTSYLLTTSFPDEGDVNQTAHLQGASSIRGATWSEVPGRARGRNRRASRTREPAPKRRSLNPADRHDTTVTRRIRGCIQCRQKRKRCFPDPLNRDPEAPCLTCQRAILSVSRIPCFRYKIVDSSLYRTNNHSPSFVAPQLTGPEYGDFHKPKTWAADSPIKILDLTQGYGTVLHLRVREFKAPPNDINGVDSRGRSIYAVPWALTNAEEALSSVRTYLEESLDVYLDHYLQEFDEITRLVIGAARNCNTTSRCERKALFRSLLQFWVAARFIEGGWQCCGSETLNADKLPDPLNPPSLIAPPPYIDFQIAAVVMERVLKPLQGRILKELEEMVLANRTKNWFHIFLVIFVLLQGYELAFTHELSWTRKRNYPTRYADAGRVQKLNEGAKNLLAHFHHACKGGVPFQKDFDWSCPSAQSMAELSAEEVAFVKTLVYKIQEDAHDVHIAQMSDRPDQPLWFSGQMFEAGWTAKNIDEHAPPVKQR